MQTTGDLPHPRGVLFDFGGTLMDTEYDFDAEWERLFQLCDNPRGVTLDHVRETGVRIWREIRAADGAEEAEFRTGLVEVQQQGLHRRPWTDTDGLS